MLDRYTASSSRSKVLYLVSAGVILREKNEMGCHVPCICCCSTAPTAISDASVIRQVGASGMGWERREALARASFVVLKEAMAVSVQVRFWDLALPAEERREWSGCMRSAQCGRNRW